MTATSAARPLHRLGGTLAVLALWAGVALLAWWLAWPGRPVTLELDAPAPRTILPPGRAVTLAGRVSPAATSLRCNGQPIRILPGGRFAASLPGPARPGMFLARCMAENDRGRRFAFPHGFLAGERRGLADPVDDALVLTLPRAALTARGGLLEPLNRLVQTHLLPLIAAAGQRLRIAKDGWRLGPASLEGVQLVGVDVQPGDPHALALDVALIGLALEATLDATALERHTPAVLERLLGALGGPRRLSLGRELRLKVLVRWPPGQAPALRILGLGTDRLARTVGRFGPLARLLTRLSGLLSTELEQALGRTLDGVERLAAGIRRARGEVEARLTRLAALLPPLPAVVSPLRPTVCLGVGLNGLQTGERSVRLRLRAWVKGFVVEDGTCAAPRPLPAGAPLGRVHQGAPDPDVSADRPAIVIAHDLLNAWLAALWASGSLDRVPVRLPELAEHGFAVRALRYRLPPVITSGRRDHLRFELPELGVELETLDEPRRWFALQLSAPLAVERRPGPRVRLGLSRREPPALHLRCESQGAAESCSRESGRYQDLVDVGLAVALSPAMATPRLAVEAALPTLRAGGLAVSVRELRPVPRGLAVILEVR